MNKLNQFFDSGKSYGIIFLRLVIGWRLIAGVWDYAMQIKPMSEVAGFFEQLHLPLPAVSAFVSVYAQFICGILFILGLWTRAAAIFMIINFTVAILAAHLQDGIEQSFAAWAILSASVLFLFNGSGKPAVDNLLNRGKRRRVR